MTRPTLDFPPIMWGVAVVIALGGYWGPQTITLVVTALQVAAHLHILGIGRPRPTSFRPDDLEQEHRRCGDLGTGGRP